MPGSFVAVAVAGTVAVVGCAVGIILRGSDLAAMVSSPDDMTRVKMNSVNLVIAGPRHLDHHGLHPAFHAVCRTVMALGSRELVTEDFAKVCVPQVHTDTTRCDAAR